MASSRATLAASSFTDFGTLLRVLRHRARLTQRQLGIAVGYSEAQISRLEQGRRRPDPTVVAALFLPALRLGSEPELAARLHELAVSARDVPVPGYLPERDASPTVAPGGDAADLAAIPSLPSHYVERAAALGELRDLLASERSVLISGLPGVGKTSLAAALARERAAGGAVCWVTLTAGVTTSAEAVVRLLARFLVRHGHDEARPVCGPVEVEQPLPRDEQLYLITKAMGRARMLICLDNLHLLRGEPQTRAVIEHLAGSAPAEFLAVSREDLPLAGFTAFRLGGLARGEARELVGELAGPLVPGPLADTLIDRTGGSPMLIRLALGQLRPGGPAAAEVIGRLEAEPGVVGYLLQATLGDLSEPSRRLISLAAVFRHPVDLLDERLIDASESLGGRYDVLAGLDELRRRQLVDHPARADLHPLVRDYCYATLLGAAAGRRRLHRLAAAHCERVLNDPLEAGWHYLRAGDSAEAADLLAARTAEIVAGGRSGPAADLAAELLAAGKLTGETERVALITRGDLLLHTERAGEAEEAYRDALARPAPPVVRAEAAWRLAQSLLQRGRVPEALELCRATASGLTGDEEVLRAQLGVVRSRAHLMLSEFGEAAAGAWLALLGLIALATRWWQPAPGPASLMLRGEPPAVVSLLARRVRRDAYPATLLDLAARGWIGLGEAEPSRVMCLPAAGRRDDPGLTDYERLALAHLEFRAAGMGVVPGTALDSGFEIGDSEFHKRFEDEVRADARSRGLLRSRIGRGTLALLEVVGVAGMLLTDAALALHHAAIEIVTASIVYLIFLQAPWALYRRTRLTHAGRIALAEWLGFRVALIGSRSGRTAGTAMLAAAGDRRIAYAAALGTAPDAVAAFSASADRNHIWSSFGGGWHRVRLGKRRAKTVPGVGMLVFLTLMGLPFAGIVLLALKSHGLKWALIAVLFPGCVWWSCAIWIYGSAVRAARLPRLAEFDGQILRLWTEASGEETQAEDHCIAIDDGVREQAWTMTIAEHVYASARAGMLVHVRIDPRRNALLGISPVSSRDGCRRT